MTTTPRKPLVSLAGALVACLSLWALYDLSARYQSFRLPDGPVGGDYQLPPAELVFYAWYFACGLVAAAGATVALGTTALVDRLERGLRRALASRWFVPMAVVVVLVEVLVCKELVLERAHVSTDESAYVFIARTLAKGRIVNPPPGDDDFFRSTFVVLSDQGWYGKYPIGHPLLLAIGSRLGLERFIVPLLGALTVKVTHWVGERLFSPMQAGLAVLLIATSPQFVLTAATEHSQPSACLAMLLGLAAALKARASDGRVSYPWVGASGFAWGFCILVRPMPGALFAAAAVLWALIQWRDLPVSVRARALAVAAPGVLACGAVLLWVNQRQSGDAMVSGYHTMHRDLAFFARHEGLLSNSLFGALVRQNFWLFGWPLSFLFVPFALGQRRAWPLMALVIAGYAYRVTNAKVMVGTTGPIYVAELVPLLALLTASGLARLRSWLCEHGIGALARWASCAALAQALVALAAFDVVEVRQIQRIARRHRAVWRLLDQAKAQRALVFTNQLVLMGADTGWAMTPPPPSPDLDDDVLFLRRLSAPDTPQRSIELWQRRFADRSAWAVEFLPDGRAALRRLTEPADFPSYALTFYAVPGTYGVPPHGGPGEGGR